MSAMLDVVLKMTFGWFVNKARSSLSEKLKDGGLNAQQFRELIMSDLQDIKSKLDGLVRGNLLASASNIEEGFGILYNLRIDNDSLFCNNAESREKLLEEVNEMKRKSGVRFISAMELFKNANTKATDAFNNEGLSLEDRVLATKLRVQSRLLLSLEDPSLASESCRVYLEQLHRLPSVVATFRSHLEGGVYDKMLSFFTHEKPQELVFSVSLINITVFKFLKRFTSGPITVYDWPNLVGNGGWTYNPLIPAKSVNVELQSAGIELPHLVVLEDLCGGMHLAKSVKRFAVKSDGDLVLGTVDADCHVVLKKVTMRTDNTMNVNHNTDNTMNVIETDDASANITSQHLLLLAIDSGDNMYLLTDRDCTHSGAVSVAPRYCELFAFDSNGDETNCCEVGSCRDNKAIASTPDGFVVVLYDMDHSNCEVEFYKNTQEEVERTSTFQAKLWESLLVAVTNKYQVIAVEEGGCTVRVYEKDGKLVREFELSGGKNEPCVSIAFNHLTEEVVFVTCSRSGYYHLSTYAPETGKRHHCTRLTVFGKSEEGKTPPRLTSHCKGSMALVSSEYVLYIQ